MIKIVDNSSYFVRYYSVLIRGFEGNFASSSLPLPAPVVTA